jgi:integrase
MRQQQAAQVAGKPHRPVTVDSSEPIRLKRRTRDELWEKIKGTVGLYRYRSSGVFYANVRRSGKLYTASLRTKDRSTALRLLRDFRARLDRTDPKYGRISFVDYLEQHYVPRLHGSPATIVGKLRIIERVRATWLKARTQPMADLRPSEVERWLNEQFGSWSSGYFNSALMLIRDAFERAKADHALMENPVAAAGLKYRKRTRPIRLTPSWQQFQAIIEDVRAQKFAPDAEASADLLQAMGLLGLGQAELAGMKREHVDLDARRIIVYRRKTAQSFTIPLYPQASELVERLCQGKRHHQHLFAISQARKALRHACKRLGFPRFSHRSLRRCFITRCLELGIDVQSIAKFQGHRDGGKLILDTYGFVSDAHSRKMATMLVSEQPENVVRYAQEA